MCHYHVRVLSSAVSPSEDSDDERKTAARATKVDEEEWLNWQSHDVDIRGSLGMPPDHKPWTQHAKLVGVPARDRFRSTIDVAYFAWLKQQANDKPVPRMPRWCVDISQGVERKPWSSTPRTLLQHSLTYVFGLGRVMDAEDRSL